MVAIRAADRLWQETLTSAAMAPLYAVVPIEVDVASGPAATARVNVERIEPRTMWQMALGIYTALRGHGLDAHIELAKVGSSDPSVAPLHLELTLPLPPDPGALMVLLDECLAPLRTPAPATLEPAPSRPEGPIIRIREDGGSPEGADTVSAAEPEVPRRAAWHPEPAPAPAPAPAPRPASASAPAQEPEPEPNPEPVISVRTEPFRPGPDAVPAWPRPDPAAALPRGRLVRVRPRSADVRVGKAQLQAGGSPPLPVQKPEAVPVPAPAPPEKETEVAAPFAASPPTETGPALAAPAAAPTLAPAVPEGANRPEPFPEPAAKAPTEAPTMAPPSPPAQTRGPWQAPTAAGAPSAGSAPRPFARPLPGTPVLRPPAPPGTAEASGTPPARAARGDAPPSLPWPAGFPAVARKDAARPIAEAVRPGPARPLANAKGRPPAPRPPRIWENQKAPTGQVVTGWDFRSRPQGQPVVRRRG